MFLPENSTIKYLIKKVWKRFKHWVTSEVLPSLRQNGAYIVGQENMSPEQIVAAGLIAAQSIIENLKERCQFLGRQTIEQQKIIDELQPKATYYDLILQCPDSVSATEIAKDYGMSAARFNRLLHDLKIQFKQSGIWFLYQKYAGFGYTKMKTHNYSDECGGQLSRQHMYWTQKGRLFLYGFLKEKDIIPMIEQMT
ncbi:phage antirepressor KilAC domain-containing protein [Candidatus Acetatifactor stercoripullorum]|uniref:phage antirepressor KilAC domain-containing protein n=1 Tax=Candidatus Acetatifactor stercoripullorum TaxID=2838414 RepID=UPI00298DAC6F|nr:phage antirepressor KilAC domain-containing protein [Candidatus Acetatifactor stercoripullorum]